MEVLQHRGEVRCRLRQHTPPRQGGSRAADLVVTRTLERRQENGVRWRRRHGDGSFMELFEPGPEVLIQVNTCVSGVHRSTQRHSERPARSGNPAAAADQQPAAASGLQGSPHLLLWFLCTSTSEAGLHHPQLVCCRSSSSGA